MQAIKPEKLFVDLVPRTAWFSNLRSELTASEWDFARKLVAREAGHRCEACGGRGPQHPVECHERWHYDEKTKVQTLIGLVALCPACHEATHFGLATIRGRDAQALAQLKKVRGWPTTKAKKHVDAAFDAYAQRSCFQWTLDARWLLEFIPVSDKTKAKIMSHCQGLIERGIQPWQAEIRDASDAVLQAPLPAAKS